MKKTVFTLGLCLVAGLSFAQKKSVNIVKAELRGEKPNVAELRTLIKGALTNPETADKAETWKIAGDIENKTLSDEQAKMMVGQKPNEDAMYPALYEIYPYYEKAYSLDILPDAKGKVKPKYAKDIKAIMLANRPYYVNAGSYYYGKKDYRKAYECFKFYGDYPTLPMFQDDAESLSKFENLETDSSAIQYLYFSGLSAELIPDYPTAIEVYERVKDSKYMNNNELYQHLADLYNLRMKDTVNYVRTLKAGVEKFPNESYYLLNLININIIQNKPEEAINYLDKAIEVNPNDSKLYYVRAYVYEQIKDDDKAIEYGTKALAVEPDYVDALVLVGRIYFNQGLEMQSNASTIRDRKLQNTEFDKAHEKFKQAIPYFEKAYSLKPDEKSVVYGLRSIYYSLDNNKEYDKWEKIYNDLSK